MQKKLPHMLPPSFRIFNIKAHTYFLLRRYSNFQWCWFKGIFHLLPWNESEKQLIKDSINGRYNYRWLPCTTEVCVRMECSSMNTDGMPSKLNTWNVTQMSCCITLIRLSTCKWYFVFQAQWSVAFIVLSTCSLSLGWCCCCAYFLNSSTDTLRLRASYGNKGFFFPDWRVARKNSIYLCASIDVQFVRSFVRLLVLCCAFFYRVLFCCSSDLFFRFSFQFYPSEMHTEHNEMDLRCAHSFAFSFFMSHYLNRKFRRSFASHYTLRLHIELIACNVVE